MKDYLALAISAFFSPYLIAFPLVVFLSFKVSPTPLTAFKWIFIALIFATLIPLGEILFRHHAKGGGYDLHLAIRKERPTLFMIALLSGFLGLFFLVFLGAPKVLITLGLSFLFLGLIVTVITLFWKISAHTAGVAAVLTAALLILGPKVFPLFLLIPLVGWARVERGKHNFYQVAGGALAAIASVTLVFFIRELL